MPSHALTEILSKLPGNLTSDQQKALRETYRRLFELYDQNKVSGRTMTYRTRRLR